MKFPKAKLIILILTFIYMISLYVSKRLKEGRCNLSDNRHIHHLTIEKILVLHNEIRQKIVQENTASDKPGLIFPPASDMMEMVWDDNLSIKAQIIADRCDKVIPSLKNNITIGENKIGENIFMERTLDFSPNDMNWDNTVANWYKESKKFKNGDLLKNYIFQKKTNNFSQLIWAKTFQIGCGYSTFKKIKFLTKLYICLYGPTGIVDNQPIY